jgi:hypothetical protein
MVTDEKIYNIALLKYRMGVLLVWLGVLTWLPFILLRVTGEKPSLFWYLPFHLAGVIGGSRLRSSAQREMGKFHTKKNLLQLLGHGMILMGILVWAPYFYLKAVHQQPVEVMNFLPYHLAGVLGGITLLGMNYWISRKEEGNA